MKYIGVLLLVYVGMFSKFTSSEFWPITISKTWFDFPMHEQSMVQKPLLTMILAAIHLLPLNDIVHLVFVKFLFSIAGAFGVLFLVNYVLIMAGKTNDKENALFFNLVTVFVALISSTFFTFFFNIRSDQIAFSLFALFLYLTEKKDIKYSLIVLLLIPLFGIKEILFIPAGVLYYYFSFKDRFSKKITFYAIVGTVVVLIWAIALNIPYLYYFISSYQEAHYLERYFILNLKLESLFIAASVLVMLYNFKIKSKNLFKVSALSLYFLLVLITIPQAYFFLVASLILLIFLPFIVFVISLKKTQTIKWTLAALLILPVFGYRLYQEQYRLNSVFPQYKYVSVASKLIKKNNFQYMDGIGILPKQNFYPCFVSPADEASNYACLNTSREPEVIIVTNRLAYLGDKIFKKAEAKYTQVLPNLWVLNSKMTDELKTMINLDAENLPLPILIFN